MNYNENMCLKNSIDTLCFENNNGVTIMYTDDERYMQLVIEEARERIYKGESPFAAGILVDGEFFIAGNMTRTEHNPNFHAEIMCINQFCKNYDYRKLENATLYSSCEPCLMCFHSIINTGIKRIVYGATIDDAIKYDSGDIPIHITKYAKLMNYNISIKGKVLENEAISVFKECIEYRGEL